MWNLSTNYDREGPCNRTEFFTAKNLSDKTYVADMSRELTPRTARLEQAGQEGAALDRGRHHPETQHSGHSR